MTALSDSSLKRPLKLILIAGLNNNDAALAHLGIELRRMGHDVYLLNLPGQGNDRSETETFERATQAFDQSIRDLATGEYGIVAFSTGALYYNLWLKDHAFLKPQFQVLLSPAFIMRNKALFGTIFRVLPAGFKIRSVAPPKFRRYSWMNISEYRLLQKLQDEFACLPASWLKQTPFKIIIDKRDELVSEKELSKRWPDQTKVLKRSHGTIRPGMYHAIFHPDFWVQDEWDEFVRELLKFN